MLVKMYCTTCRRLLEREFLKGYDGDGDGDGLLRWYLVLAGLST